MSDDDDLQAPILPDDMIIGERFAWAHLPKTGGMATERLFRIVEGKDLVESLKFLGSQGVLEVLVEAGPTLVAEILKKSLWNEKVTVRADTTGQPDRIEIDFNRSWVKP